MTMEKGKGKKEEAQEAVQKAKNFIKQKDYKEARDWMKRAIKLYPRVENQFEMTIICEILYYGNNKDFVDWYSLVHLHPSATDVEVKLQIQMLITCTKLMELDKFPGASDAVFFLKQAKSVLCVKPNRVEFDMKRAGSGLIDIPLLSKCVMFEEKYLDWIPPVSKAESCELMSEKKPSFSFLPSPSPPAPPRTPSVFSQLIKPKTQLFDEIPQNPHYSPISNYCLKLRGGMMRGLDLVFSNLSEEIQNLEDPKLLWDRFDGFMEELTQFEEMGYSVDKLRERLEALKKIAQRVRASEGEIEKLETEARELETKIGKRKAHVLELEVEIKQSKIIFDKFVFEMNALKKESMEVVTEFALVAKKRWNEG